MATQLIGQLLPLLSNSTINGGMAVYAPDGQIIGSLIYPSTPAEFNAGISAQNINFTYPVGNVLRYGADANGVTDSSVALQRALNATAFGTPVVQSSTGVYNAIRLSGAANFTLTSGGSLTLRHNGVQWYEVGRSA
jgi:hypothetical protein